MYVIQRNKDYLAYYEFCDLLLWVQDKKHATVFTQEFAKHLIDNINKYANFHVYSVAELTL